MEHPSAVATLDTHGTVTGWSEGARRLTGYPAEEAVGRAARELLAEDVPADVLATLSGTVRTRHRDGTLVALSLRARALTGADGRPAGYAVTVEPPGGGRTSLAELAFEQAAMSMSIFDTRQHYLRLNEVACQVMGVPEEELTGRYFSDSVEDAEHSQGFLHHLRQVAETGRPARYESFTGAPALNRDHAWTTEMWPVRDASGELLGTALAAFDSTEQYWARERLALLNKAAAAIGTTLDLVRTAEELVEVVVPRFADFASVDLLEWVLGTEEPIAAQPPVDTSPATIPAAPAPVEPAPAQQPPASTARQEPAPSRPAAGRLLVRSTPTNAMVVIDGVWSGRTPFTKDGITFGRHTVRVVLEGYEPINRTVEFSAERPAQQMTFELVRSRRAPNRPQRQ